MKRSEMREVIEKELMKTIGGDAAKYISEDILYTIERAGMKPPRVDDENFQALTDVYVYPLLYQWDEDVKKDAHVMKVKQKRAEWAAKRTKKIQS